MRRAKVRLLARGIDPAPFVLETLPKVGYRLVAHEGVDRESATAGHASVAVAQAAVERPRWQQHQVVIALVVIGFAAVSVSAASALLPRDAAPSKPQMPIVQS